MNVGKGRDKSTRKKIFLLKSNDKKYTNPIEKDHCTPGKR